MLDFTKSGAKVKISGMGIASSVPKFRDRAKINYDIATNGTLYLYMDNSSNFSLIVLLGEYSIGGVVPVSAAAAQTAFEAVFPEGSSGGGAAALTSATVTAASIIANGPGLINDYNVLDATDDSLIVDLPLASAWANKFMHVKRKDVSANTITVNADDEMDGKDFVTLDAVDSAYSFFSDGTTWHIQSAY